MRHKVMLAAAVTAMFAQADSPSAFSHGDADWMRGKVGLMVHWLYPKYGDT